MTDTTGKNASMIADDCPWTEEELEKMIAKDTLVKMKCVACGHIATLVNLRKKTECQVKMVKLK